MRPREVQALIRAGPSAEEVADRAGWTVEKVRRYEGPILAERESTSPDLARRSGSGRGAAPRRSTVRRPCGRVAPADARARRRPRARARWDAWRGVEETLWTVVLTFAAGGRQRQAAWPFDPVLRTVEAADDEARWLSADEPTVDRARCRRADTSASTSVYDVEAEGGVAASHAAGRRGRAGRPARRSRSTS